MHGLVAVDWHVIWQQVFHPHSILFHVLWATIYISVVSQVLGSHSGSSPRSPHVAVRPVALALGDYVWIFRGTPLLVQIFSSTSRLTWPAFTSAFWSVPSAATPASSR